VHSARAQLDLWLVADGLVRENTASRHIMSPDFTLVTPVFS
jgi:hypothetical protein